MSIVLTILVNHYSLMNLQCLMVIKQPIFMMPSEVKRLFVFNLVVMMLNIECYGLDGYRLVTMMIYMFMLKMAMKILL